MKNHFFFTFVTNFISLQKLKESGQRSLGYFIKNKKVSNILLMRRLLRNFYDQNNDIFELNKITSIEIKWNILLMGLIKMFKLANALMMSINYGICKFFFFLSHENGWWRNIVSWIISFTVVMKRMESVLSILSQN